MRPVFYSLFFLLSAYSLLASTPNLHHIRAEFHKAALDLEKVESFYQYMSDFDDKDPILKAYKAASEALMAQVIWNPIEKYQKVKKFEELIRDAVIKEPHNLEIRFLRFSVEYSIPRVLGVSNNLTADRDMIVANLERVSTLELDPYFTRYILYFLRETKLCEEEYLSKIEAQLPKG